MRAVSERTAILSFVAVLSGCALNSNSAGLAAGTPPISQLRCASSEVVLHFDFPGASPARCVIEGDRKFALVIAPEHAPPINPSPWYAFRYTAPRGGEVTVRLDYLVAKHRYAPKLMRDGRISELPVSLAKNGRSALLTLPEGSGTVSAQPIVDASHFAALARKLARDHGGKRIELGRSRDDRPVWAIRFGKASAKKTIVILGRQHPPEVTGTYALEPFVRELARRLQQDPQLGSRYQLLAIPLLNPDGVERGHWRANRGGVDLNRDWGPFSQPETRAVRDWLEGHLAETSPVAMIDFHSTTRNLFYVQGDEASDTSQRFLETWLAGREKRFLRYAFTIERRNTAPGQTTAKNWFFNCFAIPAYTYEVSDDANAADVAEAAEALAADLLSSLSVLSQTERSKERREQASSGQCPISTDSKR